MCFELLHPQCSSARSGGCEGFGERDASGEEQAREETDATDGQHEVILKVRPDCTLHFASLGSDHSIVLFKCMDHLVASALAGP